MGNLFLIKEPFPKDIWIKWCILYLHVSKCSPWVVTNLAIQLLKFSHSQLLLPKLFSKVMLNSVGAVSTVFPQTFVLPLSLFIKRWLFLLAASFQRFSLVSLPPVSCPFLQRFPFQFFFLPYFHVIALHMDLILASCSQLFNGACTELHIVSSWLHPPRWLGGNESIANAGDARDSSLIPRSGRSSEEGNGNPLQYSCPGNPMDRGAW